MAFLGHQHHAVHHGHGVCTVAHQVTQKCETLRLLRAGV
jgi:hypothetical protein